MPVGALAHHATLLTESCWESENPKALQSTCSTSILCAFTAAPHETEEVDIMTRDVNKITSLCFYVQAQPCVAKSYCTILSLRNIVLHCTCYMLLISWM